jgi:hypothetical protein
MHKLIEFFMNCTIEQLVVGVIIGAFVIRWVWDIVFKKEPKP